LRRTAYRLSLRYTLNTDEFNPQNQPRLDLSRTFVVLAEFSGEKGDSVDPTNFASHRAAAFHNRQSPFDMRRSAETRPSSETAIFRHQTILRIVFRTYFAATTYGTHKRIFAQRAARKSIRD
jgi:hypothetical protein